MGCHKTQAQADDQLTAMNIAEYGTRELPDNYRPASSNDVPEGRNCANCYFYKAGYCDLWDDNVQADYYCNRWAEQQRNYDKDEDKPRYNTAKFILQKLKKEI
jgi:hypothetical protein